MEVETAGIGSPVLVFHGAPGSRIDARFWSATATTLGIEAQFVAFDRPGYGRAMAEPGRTLRSVAEAAARIVDVEVRLLAVSAGAPFALATAALIGEQAVSVTLVSGASPPGLDDRHGLHFEVRDLSETAVRTYVEGLVASTPLPPPTGVAAVDLFVESLAEGMRSPEGMVEDILSIREPWSIALDSITAKVRHFHAVDDERVPIEGARFLAGAIPSAELVEWPDGGHAAAGAHMPEILASVTA